LIKKITKEIYLFILSGKLSRLAEYDD